MNYNIDKITDDFFDKYANEVRNYIISCKQKFHIGEYQCKGDIIDVLNSSLEYLVSKFSLIVKDSFHTLDDVKSILLCYSIISQKTCKSQRELLVKETLKSILAHIPTLNISDSQSVKSDNNFYSFAELIALTELIGRYSEVRNIQAMCNTQVISLWIDDEFIQYKYINKDVELLRNKLVGKSDIIRKGYLPSETLSDFGNLVHTSCGEFSSYMFDLILGGDDPNELLVIDNTNIDDKSHSFVFGLVFGKENSSFFESFLKPNNPNLRPHFRPLIEVHTKDGNLLLTTPFIFKEAIEEICYNLIPYGQLPKEWEFYPEFVLFRDELHNKYGSLFENEVSKILLSKYKDYSVFKNIKSINSISLEKTKVAGTNRKVGEIDFIVIDEEQRTVYIIESKNIKATYHFQSFTYDKNTFDGYFVKLHDKEDWVKSNLDMLSKEYNFDCTGYTVKSLYVTNSLVFFGLFCSDFPIIPLSHLLKFLETNNPLCVLN